MSVAAARAEACVGVRFRPHGRLAAYGLDCVGLIGVAHDVQVPDGYPLRGRAAADVETGLAAVGFVKVDGVVPGDVLLLAAGPFQHHLAIATADGFVHADAGLRRVVAVPGAPRWPLVSCWRREG